MLEIAPSRILFGASAKPSQSALRFQGIGFDSFSDLADEGPDQPVTVAGDALVYIIFTSGTTGTPKGVMIEAESVAQFIEIMHRRFRFGADNRVAEASELTFDASVFDMFMAWSAGAALYVMQAAQLMAPAKFIRDHELTIWFSVPSTASFMGRMKMLKPGAFPSLRCSIFAGEALSVATAQAWQIAAPNSIVENFYGPTEVTVDCIAQRLEDPPYVTRNRGTLAIGTPFPGIRPALSMQISIFYRRTRKENWSSRADKWRADTSRIPNSLRPVFPHWREPDGIARETWLSRIPPGRFTTSAESTIRSRYSATGLSLRKSKRICAKFSGSTW